MRGAPFIADETAQRPPPWWRWWLFPIFWALVFCTGLALSVSALYERHPEQLQGWGGLGLGVLLIGNFSVYMLLTWGWLYSSWLIGARRWLIVFGVQVALLLLAVSWYGAVFAWIALALLYPVLAGLPRRQAVLPVAILLLIYVATALPIESVGALLNILLQIIVNFGIALVLRLMSAQSEQLRGALDKLRQAHGELAASAAQREELAVLRERARLARAMHDNLGHALVVINVKLEAAQLLYARDAARGDAELEATRALIRSSMTELRHALADLRTPADQHAELPAALKQLAGELHARTGVAITCRIAPDLPTPPADAHEAIWYVAREALTNVERHAAAASATLTLEYPHDGWLLRVADDGAGIGPADLRRPEHYGVIGMRERMKALGGTLRIARGANGGTLVEARLPSQVAQRLAQR